MPNGIGCDYSTKGMCWDIFFDDEFLIFPSSFSRVSNKMQPRIGVNISITNGEVEAIYSFPEGSLERNVEEEFFSMYEDEIISKLLCDVPTEDTRYSVFLDKNQNLKMTV